jgi:hypothetical protein
MSLIRSHQDLLVQLARNGDPSAFYTLAAPLGLSTYFSLRNSGKTHTESMNIIVPFLKKIHKKFLTAFVAAPFEMWYDVQKKRHLSVSEDTFEAASNENSIEKIPPLELSHFESQMKLVFERNYSKFRHGKKRSFIDRFFYLYKSHPAYKILVPVCIILIGVIAVYVLLSLINVAVTISVSSPKFKYSASLPTDINKRFFPKLSDQQQPRSVAPEPLSPAANTSVQKVPSSDSIVRAPVIKKPPLPQTTQKKWSSPATVAIPNPFSSEKLKTDTLKTNPVSTDQQQNQLNPGQIEKPSITTEKSIPLPITQKKQPYASPDSSSALLKP